MLLLSISDNRNRITQTIQSLNANTKYTTTKEYDARGNLITQLDPLNRKTKIDYDALNRPVRTTDPIGGITLQTYDARDNLTQVSDALNSPTQYTFDAANRLTGEIRPLGQGTAYQYDANSNLIKGTNAKGDIRQYTYDAANRSTVEQHQTSTGVTARAIAYTYDERGLLTGYTDSGDTNLASASNPIPATANTATYTYDSKGQKILEAVTVQTSDTAIASGANLASALTNVNSTTKTTATTYHPNGLKASITYPNVVGSHTTSATANSAGITTFTYDTNNQLKTIGLPSSTAQSPKSISISAYQWTAPQQKVIPGAVMTMGYDALLRPTRTKSQAINQGNTQGTAQVPIGPIIQDTQLTYNDVSNITKRETEHGIYTYGYDDLDRLTQVVPPSIISFPNANNNANSNISLPIEAYRYDAVHNRLSSLHQTGSLTNAWAYNAHHQLTQYGDPTATSTSSLTIILHPKVTQTFNANGHLITKTVTPEDTTPAGIQNGKQSHRYTYSVSERLLQTNDGTSANNGQGAEIARYAYDPFGRRIKKTVSQNLSNQPGATTGTTLYFYGDEGLLAEADTNGIITVSYGWMPNGTWGTAPQFKRDHAGQSGTTNPLGDASTNGVEHYYHVDHLGTSQRLTNAQGEVTWRAVSEAFGRTVVDVTLIPIATGVTTNNLRFPGQYEDLETATRQNWNRDYGANVGRYLQGDPIGLEGGTNTYAYARLNPLMMADVDGKIALPLLTGGLGLIGGFYGSVVAQLLKNGGDWSCINIGDAALAGLFGFATGALLPFTGTGAVGLANTALLGGNANLAQTLVGNYLNTGNTNPEGGNGYHILQSFATGAVGGLAGGIFKPVPGINREVGALLSPSLRARTLRSQATGEAFTRNVFAGTISGTPPLGSPCGCQ